jgi:hypothetical protein
LGGASRNHQHDTYHDIDGSTLNIRPLCGIASADISREYQVFYSRRCRQIVMLPAREHARGSLRFGEILVVLGPSFVTAISPPHPR